MTKLTKKQESLLNERHGEIRDRSSEGQRYRLAGLNLLAVRSISTGMSAQTVNEA